MPEESADRPRVRIVPERSSEGRVRLGPSIDIPRFTRVEEMPLDRNPEIFGRPREGTLPLFVEDTTFQTMQDYLGATPDRERGGILLGYRCADRAGQRFVRVTDFIPNLSDTGIAVAVRFTSDDQNRAHTEAARRGLDVVGWLHSHPFMPTAPSRDDRFVMQNLFPNEGDITLISNPFGYNNTDRIARIGRFGLSEGEPINEGSFYLVGNNHSAGMGSEYVYTAANVFNNSAEEFTIESSTPTVGRVRVLPEKVKIKKTWKMHWNSFRRTAAKFIKEKFF